MLVVLTGASGNMGREALRELMSSSVIDRIRILVLNTAKEKAFAKRMQRKYGDRLQVVIGDIAEYKICETLVQGADYVLNLAAVIPPASDKHPERAERCNYYGAVCLTEAVSTLEKQPKLVHVSTVAVYGNRNYLHPWGRVGDPLLPSVYDCYAASKLRGERYVLESGLKNWAILRQTAMLHGAMLSDNMSDGLMFHTCYNVPLEWVTARDSGVLMRKIVEKDAAGQAEGFWKKCYNIGGGAPNRCTGYDTFDQGFRLIGGSTEKFMSPCWNSIRNFHGLWFSDGDVLEKMFGYQNEKISDYWQEILRTHGYYRLAKILPPSFISKIAIQRLLNDENSPRKWISEKDEGKVRAYFGSKENLAYMPERWNEYAVLAKGELADADIDYDAIRKVENIDKFGYRLSHGYDESKPDCELDIEDMRSAAEFRGGKCLSRAMQRGDLYTKLEWECHDGHRFYASPYTVLKAGHWCPECCQPEPWDFDRLAKFTPFFAQVWYDTHSKGENSRYYYDARHRARCVQYGGAYV